jgi:hypothetical protein
MKLFKMIILKKKKNDIKMFKKWILREKNSLFFLWYKFSKKG